MGMCAPHSVSAILVIEPASETLLFVEGAGDGYHGICQGADGRFYCGLSEPRDTVQYAESQMGTCIALFLQAKNFDGESDRR